MLRHFTCNKITIFNLHPLRFCLWFDNEINFSLSFCIFINEILVYHDLIHGFKIFSNNIESVYLSISFVSVLSSVCLCFWVSGYMRNCHFILVLYYFIKNNCLKKENEIKIIIKWNTKRMKKIIGILLRVWVMTFFLVLSLVFECKLLEMHSKDSV